MNLPLITWDARREMPSVRFLLLSGGDMVKPPYIVLLVATFFLAAPSLFGQTPWASHLPVIEREGFGPAESALRGKTRVPLAIPSSLPKSEEVGRFFCTAITLEPDEYELIIGWSPGCSGGNACRVGSLSGMRSRSSRIRGSRNIPFDRRGARRVRLYGGIVGYFVDATCGANCSDSHVFWKKGGYEYTAGLKVGKMAAVVEFANSAIKRSRKSRRAKPNNGIQRTRITAAFSR